MLEVPDKFANEATKYPVTRSKASKKKNGTIGFGEYHSDDVSKGWVFSRNRQDKSSFQDVIEQTVLINFGIEKGNYTQTYKDRYQFTINQGKSSTLVYCNELRVSNSIRINSRATGEINTTNRQKYNFGASILPSGTEPTKGWFLEMGYNMETPGGMLATVIREGLPAEKGIITNKTDSIVVKPVFVKQAKNYTNGKTGKFPIALLGGYEFRIGDGLAAMVDSFNGNIWFYNGLEGEYKMVIAAAAAAILLRSER